MSAEYVGCVCPPDTCLEETGGGDCLYCRALDYGESLSDPKSLRESAHIDYQSVEQTGKSVYTT